MMMLMMCVYVVLQVNGRIALSTKTLEPEPGDMLKDRQKVFANAEQTAKKYHARMEAER
jgi:ribosomal protein S1